MHAVFGFVENDAVLRFEHFFGDFDAVEAELLVDVAADLRLEVVVGWQAVHELAVGVARHVHHLLVDLVRHEQVDALLPDLCGFAHRYPNVGVEEVATLDALGDVRQNGQSDSTLQQSFVFRFAFPIGLVRNINSL